MYLKKEFKDRETQYPNRRKITVLEQSSNTIVADIEPREGDIIEEGTVFNATLMNEFQDSVIQSETISQEAIKIANDAKTQSEEAYNHVVAMQGTKVTRNGAFVANFDADTKAEQSEFEALRQRVEALENSAIMSKIVYDETTNTFNL